MDPVGRLFARESGDGHIAVARGSGADAVGLDWGVDLEWAAAHVQPIKPVQGNLAPQLVVDGGPGMEEQARRILRAFSGGPHIFNFGHGIVPETPVAHVERLVEVVRDFRL